MRRVACIRGKVAVTMRCEPRFDYGRDGLPQVKLSGDAATFTPNAETPSGPLRLRGSTKLSREKGAATAAFSIEEGDQESFVLECGNELPTDEHDPETFVQQSFKQTIAYWQSWSAHSSYKGHWREYVMRSALALKLLTSAEHGSIAAAATFGLPEEAGGSRNWDYRFCWIRDAAFATFALIRLGYTNEARRFNEWVADRADDSEAGEFQILYRLDGTSDAQETSLDHLAGYRESKPVRIGNGAASQLQLDIYGALLDSSYLSDKYGEPVTYGAWERITKTLNWVCRNWEQPDEGIWEIRGERKHFLSSRLMCWVALDRGLRMAQKRSLPAEHAAEWEKNRSLIYRDIHDNFWCEERGAFTQYKGGRTLDASALLMPLVLFITPKDPRWLSTQKAIERELTSDVLVRRYETGQRSQQRRRARRRGGRVHAVLLLAGGVPGALGRHPPRPPAFREAGFLCQRPRAVLGGDRTRRRAARQHAAGADAPRPDQRRLHARRRARQAGSADGLAGGSTGSDVGSRDACRGRRVPTIPRVDAAHDDVVSPTHHAPPIMRVGGLK